jgi:hypothetical protein
MCLGYFIFICLKDSDLLLFPDFFQEYENKISYTPEDGHVGRNM